MGSDLFALSALATELNTVLRGARIDKIQQPEVDELRFFLRNQGKNMCLVMSCNAQFPGLHLTATKKSSPPVAPAMLMLLRKYLGVANIDNVSVYNADRIIRVKFNAKTELKDDAVYFMFVEIMNRYSNLVFTDENLVVLDAVKHLPLDVARSHVVLRGVKYAPVPQPKTSYLNDCSAILDAFKGGDLRKFITSNISGFSWATVTELLTRAGIEDVVASFTPQKREALDRTLESFKNIAPEPCIISDEVYPIVYRSLDEGDNVTRFASMSEAYDALYADIDRDYRNKNRLKELTKQVKRLSARIQKNIADDLQKLKECEQMEKYRVWGELIVNNIYLLKRGDSTLHCLNYYTGEEVDIPLDVTLPPSRNSANYYAKYNKLKRTKEFVEKKLVQDRNLLSYIGSIEDELVHLPYDASLAPIEEELAAITGSKNKPKQKGKVRKEAPDPPYVYLVDGYYIYRGKNNMQNEELTFKIASSNDIWMHLKAEHGAHTIILTEGRAVPDRVLQIAAEITASTKSASCDVDWTERKNVKRQPGGHPGQVIYVNYRTILAQPDKHEEFLVKK